MITIDTKSWHYKFWSWTYHDEERVPYQTNLCSYCQRIFWVGLFWFLMGAAVLAMASGLLFWIFYTGFYLHTMRAFAVTGAIAVIVGATYLYVKWKDRPRQPGLVSQWVTAKKNRVCPLIMFEDKE